MWGGLIAGALGGAGKAVSDIAGDQIKQDQKLELMREQQAMEEQRLRLAEELARDRVVWENTGAGGDAKRSALSLNAVAQGAADVAGASAKLDAASTAGLPAKEAAYARSQFDANKQLVTDKTTQAATDAASAAVAADRVPGYTAALKNKSLAEGAAHIQVAAAQLSQALTMARKPEMVSDSDGNLLLRSWDPKTNKVSTEPLRGADGEPLKGPKDLDQRTMKMVDAILTEAKGAIDPEERKAAAQRALDLLKPKVPGAAPDNADPLGLRRGNSEAAPDKKAPAKQSAATSPALAPNGISYQPAGYGTGSYVFQGKRYGSLADAQAAKDQFEKAWEDVAAGRQ